VVMSLKKRAKRLGYELIAKSEPHYAEVS
jgi:hypothetical protein